MELSAQLAASNPLALKIIAFLAVSFLACLYGHLSAKFEAGSVGDEIILDHHEEMISK